MNILPMHNSALKRKYGENCSLLVYIEHQEDNESIKDEFDFSDYPKDHPLERNEQNVIGLMKDKRYDYKDALFNKRQIIIKWICCVHTILQFMV